MTTASYDSPPRGVRMRAASDPALARQDGGEPRQLGCRVVRPLLIHVRKRFGREQVRELCEAMGLTLEFVSDENNWISYTRYIRMLQWLVDRAGKERAAYEQGLEAATFEAYGALYFILRSFATPSIVYRAIGSQFPRWTRTGVFTPRKVGRNRAEMEFRNDPACPQHRLNCLSIQGQLAAIPTSWGLPPAYIEHPQCQVDGAPSCVYHLRWVSRPSYGLVAALCVPLLYWLGTDTSAAEIRLPVGLSIALAAMGAGFWLDLWKVLRDNRHVNAIATEGMARSLEAVEARNLALSRALDDVNRRNRTLDSLSAFSAVAATAEAQEPLIERFLAWLAQDLGYRHSAFLLANRRTGALRLARLHGVDGDEAKTLQSLELTPPEGTAAPSDWKLMEAASFLETARAADPAAAKCARQWFVNAVPLCQGQSMLGLLLLGSADSASRSALLDYGLQVSTAHLCSALSRLNEFEILDSALANVPTALVVLDEAYRVLYRNAAFHELFDLPSQEPTGESFSLQLPSELRGDLTSVLEGEAPRWREIRVAGRLVHASVFELPPAAQIGRRVGLALTDMEEREALVRQVVQSEKLASIGLLASGIAHQLNNPLYGIMGLAEAILDEEDVDKARQYVRKLLRYSEVAADIIRELNRYARASHSHSEALDPVDLNEVLDEAVELVHYAGLLDGIEVEREFGRLPPIRGNFQEIQQVFVNLLHNAGDALSGQGRIRLQTTAYPEYVEALVGDSGPGIPREHVERLFDPFFTTKPAGRGTGLGLSVVHRIVTRYSGSIEVETAPGQGTTFRIRLPSIGEG